MAECTRCDARVSQHSPLADCLNSADDTSWREIYLHKAHRFLQRVHFWGLMPELSRQRNGFSLNGSLGRTAIPLEPQAHGLANGKRLPLRIQFTDLGANRHDVVSRYWQGWTFPGGASDTIEVKHIFW